MRNKKTEGKKRAQSEIISYVLLIVIALGLASGVYYYLTKIMPSQKEAEVCSDDVSIIINDYDCIKPYNFSITLENRGLFTIDGFFIRASNDSGRLPFVMLNKTDDPLIYGSLEGRYDFIGENKFYPGNITTANFNYTNLDSIKRIQIQPYVTSTKTNRSLLLCKNLVDINLDGC